MIGREDPQIAGWYGKIPSLGDFISRRLPTSFIDPWDAWLQRSIIASHTQLGESWLNVYLTCPIWRFIIMPGICGDNFFMGILMPSVDKIGRHFPLTIAIQIEPHPDALFTAFTAHTWYASLEIIALSSLNANVSPQDLDQILVNYPFPRLRRCDHSTSLDELAEWWQDISQTGSDNYKTLTIPKTSSLTNQFEDIAKNIFLRKGLGKSIWWKLAQSSVEDTEATDLFCFAGLPKEKNFPMLLSGSGISI